MVTNGGLMSMTWHDLLGRITRNPNMMVGQPCIRGMRITVLFVLEALAAGTSREELLRDLPVLAPDDIDAALAYGSELAGIARGCGDLVERITCDPNMMVGKPCVRGMRVTVQHVLETLSAGVTEEELMDDLPMLEPADIRAALLCASKLCE